MLSLADLRQSAVKPFSLILLGGALLLAAEGGYYLIKVYLDDGSDAGYAETIQQGQDGNDALSRSLQRVKDYVLFAEPVRQVARRAPVTQMHLELFGIAMGIQTQKSSALIRVQSQTPRVFHEGDALGSGVRVQSIQADHVLIERHGALERLTFRKKAQDIIRVIRGAKAKTTAPVHRMDLVLDKGKIVPGESEAMREAEVAPLGLLPGEEAVAAAGGANAIKDSIIASAIQQISRSGSGHEQMATLMKRLSIDAGGLYSPPGEGAHIGQLIGLRPGDRVVSINGQDVGSLTANPRALAEVAAAGSVEINIRRGGEDIVITTALP